ncbi:hypothetical protein DDZ13_06725 [Coraliomargarita sinensis]|uniref:Uncharacterized protein n=1 Tax=Coraliomargarita sinensis TaxID=2174842 RepID=A0A317ZJW4_9BACT|nr:type II secretion system protein [Coraliomargarita sinensis]PXA04228.1 hypothetical protein DDZ13_06725 [Coraliomargarita sinensis]
MVHFNANPSRKAFTLIEVVLALGVFFISILALIGLLAPMLKSVDEVEKIDEITSVVNTVNAFLQSSPKIPVRDTNGEITQSKFDSVYQAVSSAGSGEATLFVFRYYDGTSVDSISLEAGFSPNENDDGNFVGTNSIVDVNLFNDAAGPIYRVVLTASSVTPDNTNPPLRTTSRVNGVYTLTQSLNNYPEGYLALEARIFAEDPPGPAPNSFDTTTDLTLLSEVEPDFTFNTAIVR